MHLIFTKLSGLCFFKHQSIIRQESIPNYRKLIMRTILLSFLLTVSGLLQASLLVGQNLKDISVNLTFKNTDLKNVFQKVEETTNIRFTYKSNDLILLNNISYSSKGQSLDIVLDELLENTGLIYEQVNDIVVVKKYINEKENTIRNSNLQ